MDRPFRHKTARRWRWTQLASWTTLTNGIHFSGVATYEKTITVAPEMLNNGLSVAFDFGQGTPSQERGGQGSHADLTPPVREAAILYINDQRAGSVWCPPYSIDVTGKLKAGENKIRIEVANLAINYMAGIQFPNYDYAGVTRQYRQPLPAARPESDSTAALRFARPGAARGERRLVDLK